MNTRLWSLVAATALFMVLAGCRPKQEITPPLEKAYSYEALKKDLIRGWNTWDNRNITTHVLLPEGLGVKMWLKDPAKGDTLKIAFIGNRVPNTEVVRTRAHTPDGSYTDMTMLWRGIHVRVQSTASGKNLSMLVTPVAGQTVAGKAVIKSEMMYGRTGNIVWQGNGFNATTADTTFNIRILSPEGPVTTPELEIGDGFAITSIPGYTVDSVVQALRLAENACEERVASFGDQAEIYRILSNALKWNVVYDHVKDRVVSPVARTWAFGWGKGKEGGYVLFCWDNFFAAYMHTLDSRELAFNEAIQMCFEIDELGFVPNYSGPFDIKSRDRSQPPVGSLMVREIYRKYPERWFLETVFDRLLKWNRWWNENRQADGYLCWGSNPFKSATDDARENTNNNFEAASNESGLDNTPMYDGVEFDTTTHLLPIADVGLMSLYVADCDALAEIAGILGRSSEQQELKERGERFRTKLRSMYNAETGLFLNRHLSGEESQRISPTNFYPLLAKAATEEQAETMIEKHFYNPNEFWGDWIMPSISRNDTAYTGKQYWRGSIWAPMNFLVYLGMRNYQTNRARADLADKSAKLQLTEWHKDGFVRENYDANTGTNPGSRSENFYHWGALLSMINLIEHGHVAPPEKPLK